MIVGGFVDFQAEFTTDLLLIPNNNFYLMEEIALWQRKDETVKIVFYI